ncbi:MAG: Arc family DNA-binding protein [Spirochaetales bacterium]|nr:Arc family DNA-binding protein [Spirochaetales bacterium]
MEDQGKNKKQVLLRLSPTLWRELAAWAEEDFRSINGQIEFLLTQSVRHRRKEDKTDAGARRGKE